MTKETIYEVLTTLVGDTSPIGESFHDEKAMSNLRKLEWVVSQCIDDIDRLSANRVLSRYSTQMLGKEADVFLEEIRARLYERSIANREAKI